MPPVDALYKKKNKYGYWVDPTHPSYPHASTPDASNSTQMSPKRPRVDMHDPQSSAQRAKRVEASKELESYCQPPVAVDNDHDRSTRPEPARKPAREPFTTTPCPDSPVIPNNPFTTPSSSTGDRIRSAEKYVRQALQSVDGKCRSDSTALDNTGVDVEHLFTFTASACRKRNTELFKSEPVELVSWEDFQTQRLS